MSCLPILDPDSNTQPCAGLSSNPGLICFWCPCQCHVASPDIASPQSVYLCGLPLLTRGSETFPPSRGISVTRATFWHCLVLSVCLPFTQFPSTCGCSFHSGRMSSTEIWSPRGSSQRGVIEPKLELGAWEVPSPSLNTISTLPPGATECLTTPI